MDLLIGQNLFICCSILFFNVKFMSAAFEVELRKRVIFLASISNSVYLFHSSLYFGDKASLRLVITSSTESLQVIALSDSANLHY